LGKFCLRLSALIIIRRLAAERVDLLAAMLTCRAGVADPDEQGRNTKWAKLDEGHERNDRHQSEGLFRVFRFLSWLSWFRSIKKTASGDAV
jgi:hypothetical protein